MTDAGTSQRSASVVTPNPEESAPEAPRAATPAPKAATPAPKALTMSGWGRRASLVYLGVCAIALVAMLVETLTGRGGVGTMFAAILAVPWSMLAANLLPPFPSDWPLPVGLGARLTLLALFMVLNAAIVRGIAARYERDLAHTATRLSVLLVLAAVLSNGCTVWGPIHLAVDAERRVSWNEGAALLSASAQALKGELAGDGRFSLLVVSRFASTGLGAASVDNFRIGAVL